ncbi:Delta protein, partial [Fasciolopsis buskii]
DYGGANLLIEWTYNNPGSLLEDGRACDRLGNPKCDVFFTLCLRNAAEKRIRRDAQQCLLHQYTTQHYDNVDYLEFTGIDAVPVFIPTPVPASYTFEISIYDIDLLGRTQPIGSFIAEGFHLTNKGASTQITMRRKNHQYANIRLELRVRMTLKCVENFYGEHCTKKCAPNPPSYTCNDDGNRVCMPGHVGELCDKEDSCLYQPCAEHATCMNKPDGLGRICQCNGHEGPECYPDYDPCSSSPCQHGGSCQRMGQYNESFDCICTSLWTGYRCTDRRLACAEELERLEREANTTNGKTSVCLNGGTCLEYTDRLAFRCVCQKGWTGTICEEQEAEAAKSGTLTMILIIFIGAVLLILTVVLIAIFIWRYRTSKQRAKMLEKHGGIVYFHANSTSSCTMNSLVGSPGQFVNQIYGTGPNGQPVFILSSNLVNKGNSHDVYDECDPLGLSTKNDPYDTAFGSDVPSPEGRLTITTRSSLCSTHVIDDAPPLPERPKKLSPGLTRHSSLYFTESGRNSGTVYSMDGSTIPLIRSPGERRHPTVYRPISPVSLIPSTFVPKSAPLPPTPTEVEKC